MNLDYRTDFAQKTWVLPSSYSRFGGTVTCGFWMRETVDRIVEPEVRSYGHKYQYKSLPADGYIRLLHLDPGQPGTPLHGRILTSDTLARCPHYRPPSYRRLLRCDRLIESQRHGYETISYCWGDVNDTTYLDVEGGSLAITKSIYTALTYLRSKTNARRLWIDQICINQDDYQERSQQVGMMVDIYAAADRVYAWLGTPSGDSAAGLMALQSLLCYSNASNDHDIPTWCDLRLDIAAAGLRDILGRTWFQRLWVVQEAAVARNITLMCGLHTTSWANERNAVCRFIRNIKVAALAPELQRPGFDKIDFEPLLKLLVQQEVSGPSQDLGPDIREERDLLDIAYDMRDRACADYRDRIFAVLGLADPPLNRTLQPDYSMSVEQVYDTFRKAMLGPLDGYGQPEPDFGNVEQRHDAFKKSTLGQSDKFGQPGAPNENERHLVEALADDMMAGDNVSLQHQSASPKSPAVALVDVLRHTATSVKPSNRMRISELIN